MSILTKNLGNFFTRMISRLGIFLCVFAVMLRLLNGLLVTPVEPLSIYIVGVSLIVFACLVKLEENDK